MRSDALLVCEGMPDALTAAQAGFRSVGLLGAQTPDEVVAARLANHAQHHGLEIVDRRRPRPRRAPRRRRSPISRPTAGRCRASITPPDGLDLNAWALADPTWYQTIDAQLDAPRSQRRLIVIEHRRIDL